MRSNIWSLTCVLAVVWQAVPAATYTCDDVFTGKITHSKNNCAGEIESWCRIDLAEENTKLASKYIQLVLNSTNKLCFGCPEENFVGQCKTLIACTHNSHCYKARIDDNYGHHRYYYGCAQHDSTTCFGTDAHIVIWNRQSFSNGDMALVQNLLQTTTTSTTTATTTTTVQTTKAIERPSSTVAPTTSSFTTAQKTPSTTAGSTAPSTTAVPTGPSTTAVPTTPSTTAVPTAPSTKAVPTAPSTTAVPTTPSTTAVPTVPSTTAIPTAPSTSPVQTTISTNVTQTTPSTTTAPSSTLSKLTTQLMNATKPHHISGAATVLMNTSPTPSTNSVLCVDDVDHGFNCTEFELLYKICSHDSGPSGEIAYTKCRKTCGHCNDTMPQYAPESTVTTQFTTLPSVLPTNLPPCHDDNATLCTKLIDICTAADPNTHAYALAHCAKMCNLCTEYYYNLYAQMTTTVRSTRKTTTIPPTVAVSSIQCHQCGDVDHAVPCSHRDTFVSTPQKCDDGKGFCQTDVYQDAYNNRRVFKRCVTEPVCKTLWFDQSSDLTRCTNYDNNSPPVGEYECHFCCTKDGCNAQIKPPDANTLYIHTKP